jgi:hypothetical protein
MIKSMTVEFHHAANQRFAVHRLATEYRDAGISIVPIRLAMLEKIPHMPKSIQQNKLFEQFDFGVGKSGRLRAHIGAAISSFR